MLSWPSERKNHNYQEGVLSDVYDGEQWSEDVFGDTTEPPMETWAGTWCLRVGFEVSLARRQNLKLAWEDAWNHGKMELSVKWLSHGSVRP